MGTFVSVSQSDFESFVLPLGFQPLNLPGTKELVYGKRMDCRNHPFTVRIYSGINPDGNSRGVGSDAIRVCLVSRNSNGKVFGCQKDRRVNRTQNWRANLSERLTHFRCDDIAWCPRCDAPAAYSKRTGKHYCSAICWKND